MCGLLSANLAKGGGMTVRFTGYLDRKTRTTHVLSLACKKPFFIPASRWSPSSGLFDRDFLLNFIHAACVRNSRRGGNFS